MNPMKTIRFMITPKISFSLLVLLPGRIVFAQPPQLPANYPPGLYDESKVPSFTLPDPLILENGDRVADTTVWKEQRRLQILQLFESAVYGRTMMGRPQKMIWKLTSENRHASNDSIIAKTVTIYFTGKRDGPKMNLKITISKNSAQHAPIFLVPGWLNNQELLYRRGYGLANFEPWEVEPDNKDSAYVKDISHMTIQHWRY